MNMSNGKTTTGQCRYARGLRNIVLLVVVFAAGAFWRGRNVEPAHGGGSVIAADASAARPPQIYTCSMHPQIRTPDANAKCPICAMDLIPVPTEDEHDAADDGNQRPRLRLSRHAAALSDIRTWPVEQRPVELEIPLFGMVDFDQSRLFDVVARIDAYVERLVVNTPWQAVAEGELLAELYSPVAVSAMHELLLARPAAPAVLAASRARLLRMGITPEQIAQVLETGEVPPTFRLLSPAAGVVADLMVRQGEWLREGNRLARIVDLAYVWLNFAAYERDLRWLQPGQGVEFSTAADPTQLITAPISFIEPVLDNGSRTVQLRVEIANPAAALKPGMLVNGRVFAAYAPADAPLPLVIPASAPLLTGKRALVYVRLADQDRPTFEARQVTLGARAGDFYVVEQGLSVGELVVVNGQFKIDSELQLRGQPSMLAADGAAAPVHHHGDHAQIKLQTHCPVMGGTIDPEVYVDIDGQRIYVCCPGCDTAILDDPQPYIARLVADGVTIARLQTHCPIMNFPINRALYFDYEQQRIYLCCAGCLPEVEQRAAEIIDEHRQRGIFFEALPAAASPQAQPPHQHQP